jgi:hypothetical protein
LPAAHYPSPSFRQRATSPQINPVRR